MTTLSKLKKEFEANLLDGDKVNDCGGAMLSAKEVWSFISYAYTQGRKDERKEMRKEMKKWWNGEVSLKL